MSVRALMAWELRCLRWMFEMPSGPAAGEFLSFRMILETFSGVKGGGVSWEILIPRFRLVIFRLE